MKAGSGRNNANKVKERSQLSVVYRLRIGKAVPNTIFLPSPKLKALSTKTSIAADEARWAAIAQANQSAKSPSNGGNNCCGTPIGQTQQDATAFTSKVPKVAPKKKGDAQETDTPEPQAVLKPYPDPHDVNNNDLGNPNTSMTISSPILDTYAIVSGGFAIKGLFYSFDIAEGGLNLFKFGSAQAMAHFYKGGGSKYIDAASHFFGQHPHLK